MHWLTDASPGHDARERDSGASRPTTGRSTPSRLTTRAGPGACLAIRCVPLAPQRSRLSHHPPILLLNLPIASRSLHSVTCTFTFIDRHLPFLLQPFTSLFSPVITVPRDPSARHCCTQSALGAGALLGSVSAVMSLTKLSPSGWRYFAEEIATGREDYFARAAEHPGRYLGRGAEAIGLAGAEVDALGLERLIGHGTDPREGHALGRSYLPDNDNVVAGFGLTYSPPKSVSVLWGTGEEELRTAVVAAHERAVASTLDFLQDHAAFTRRGAGGVFQVDTEGFVAASFLHRTSRAADPQLHTHVLLANKVRAEDGRWLSLDGRELYEHQKAAGMLYRAALRAELTASLGVAWTPVDDNGIAEIEGVPKVLVESWSTRRHEVESLGAELVASRETELGRELSGGERARCLPARRLSQPGPQARRRDADRRPRRPLARGGHLLGTFAGVLAAPGARPALTSTPEDREAVVHLAIARLEETRATWGRSDATGVLTTLLTGTNADELRARVEEAADEVIGDPRVCSLAAPLPAEPPDALRRRDQMSAIERHGATRYTTEATLLREARVLDAVARGATSESASSPSAPWTWCSPARSSAPIRKRLSASCSVVASRWPSSSVRRVLESPAPSARRAKPGTPPATVRSGSRPRRSRRGALGRGGTRFRHLGPLPPRCGERASQPRS